MSCQHLPVHAEWQRVLCTSNMVLLNKMPVSCTSGIFFNYASILLSFC